MSGVERDLAALVSHETQKLAVSEAYWKGYNEGEAHGMEAVTARARDTLAAHFVMWHDLDDRPGEWRCACGKKFGFSDSAIDHQAAALSERTS